MVTQEISCRGVLICDELFKDQELAAGSVFAGRRDLLSGRTMEEGKC